MLDVLEHWLKEGADGFRIDAINHMFETVGLPDEAYVDEDEDKSLYDNLIHNHTMNLVSSMSQGLLIDLFINFNLITARILSIHLRRENYDGQIRGRIGRQSH